MAENNSKATAKEGSKLTPQWGTDVAHAASAMAKTVIKSTYVVDAFAEACVNVSVKLAVATCNTEEDLSEFLACRKANYVIFNS